ncbi:MAG: zinc ribbon domain-containing protein [Chloroflexota bacterium]|nr:zinc ribbon domain-containing protein [Chloroflexota bacterium]
MPIYTYRCESCGIQFDRRQKFSDDPLKICPECEKETLRKVYQPVGIVFKGSGFYSTDNRSPSGMERSNGAASDDGENTSSPSTDSSSSDSEKKTKDTAKMDS